MLVFVAVLMLLLVWGKGYGRVHGRAVILRNNESNRPHKYEEWRPVGSPPTWFCPGTAPAVAAGPVVFPVLYPARLVPAVLSFAG